MGPAGPDMGPVCPGIPLGPDIGPVGPITWLPAVAIGLLGPDPGIFEPDICPFGIDTGLDGAAIGPLDPTIEWLGDDIEAGPLGIAGAGMDPEGTEDELLDITMEPEYAGPATDV